jgi:hypothetical protein
VFAKNVSRGRRFWRGITEVEGIDDPLGEALLGHLERGGIDRVKVDTEVCVDGTGVFAIEIKASEFELVHDFTGYVFVFLFGSKDDVVTVQDHHAVVSEEEALVEWGRCESTILERGEEEFPPQGTRSTVSVTGLVAFNHLVLEVFMVAVWGWDLEVKRFREIRLEEGSIEVNLDGVQVELDAKVVKEANCIEADDWAVGVGFVSRFTLQITANNKACFLLLLGAIGEELGNESPHERNEVFGRVFWD